MKRALSPILALALLGCPAAVMGNNVGENVAWQFQTTADKVNLAAIQDMIQKRRNGYYAAPVYTTHIDRQFNCNVSAIATGNQGTNSTIANSPSTSGNSASAIGNDSDAHVGGRGSGSIDGDQTNSGSVGSSVAGSTRTHVRGSANQALNSEQTNSGDQFASVDGSTACLFGALN